MKTDLDALMQANNLSAILATGSAQNNPAMVYLTGGGHMNGDLIKKCGEAPVVFCNPMEREEAARTGLQTRSLMDYKVNELQKQLGGDNVRALAARYRLMLLDLGVTSGRVALYGKIDAGQAYGIFAELQRIMPEITLVGESGMPVIIQAMATKDEKEVARMRKMGQITTGVVGRVADFLTSQRAQDGVLVKSDGQPVTIGEVKRLINLWLADGGADNPEGTIFAQGRDAGIPHSTGTAGDVLRLGETIVFDIFPCEPGGGYFYDFTRTWCLGYAPEPAQKLYDDVRAVYDQVIAALKPDAPFYLSQKLTCDLFEAGGHPTIQGTPGTDEGYVHSVGHGLGLHVHERPMSGATAGPADVLKAGAVFTIEPGLYYPSRGLGVRLEDTLWARPDGAFEILAPFPLDLVLPVKGS